MVVQSAEIAIYTGEGHDRDQWQTLLFVDRWYFVEYRPISSLGRIEHRGREQWDVAMHPPRCTDDRTFYRILWN